MRRAWSNIVVIVAILFGDVSAAGGNDSLRWTEDVRLPDGRIVTVTRFQEFKGPHELFQKSTESDYWFEFLNPNDNHLVRWNGNRTQQTVELMIWNRTPLLVVLLTFNGWDLNNCPSPRFLLYRYEGDRWVQRPLEEIPLKTFRSNMTSEIDEDKKSTLRAKRYLPVEITSDSFRQGKPWRITFEGLTKQTFGADNCAHETGLFVSDFGVPSATQTGDRK